MRDNLLSYGMGPLKLYVKLNNEGYPISLDDCKMIYRKYKEEVFPVACGYLQSLQELAPRQGFIATRYGRKRYFNPPKYAPAYKDATLYKEIRRRLYDDPQALLKLTADEDKAYNRVKDYNEQIGAIGREGANMKIQGGNADITKMAMMLLGQKLEGKGYDAHFANMVYDEIILEAVDSQAEEISLIQRDCMLEAEQMFLDVVPAEVDCSITQVWNKD